MRHRHSILAVCFLLAASTTQADDVFNKEAIVKAMRAVHQFQLDHPYRETDRNWIRATYYTGVMGLYRTTQDPAVLKQAIRWAEKHDWAEGNESERANKKTCGQTYLELFFLDPDPRRIAKIRAYVDSRMETVQAGEPPTKGWYYCDTLYVGPPTLAMLGRATGEQKYYDYLNEVYWDVADLLFDEEYDLFYRDAGYFDAVSPNGRKIFWSRGAGWVLGGIPRVLQYLPKDNEHYDRYVELLRKMSASIAARQGVDGLWRANLDDADQYPGPETSGTAFFCYAMTWGINQGLLDRSTYLPVVMRAWRGLVRHLQADGRLGFVQPVGADPKPATREMTHEYAMGLFLLAGEEMVKAVESGVITDADRRTLDEQNRELTDPNTSIVPGDRESSRHPLQAKIDLFLARQSTHADDFHPTELNRDDYLRLIAGQVQAMRAYQDPDGRIIDPVEKIEKYYATPCYAHAVAALAASGHTNDTDLIASGMRALDVSLADMVAGDAAGGHGDFYTWPVMLAREMLAEFASVEQTAAWTEQLRSIQPEKLYKALDAAGNWNVVNLSGEFLRAEAGLTEMEYVEHFLSKQLAHFTPLGMYSEHGNPLPYDLFPRHYLAGVLQRGYRGETYATYRELLWRGAWTSLFMQSPTGQLPTGYRSSHHIWNEAEQAALFEIYAAASADAGRTEEAGAFKRAARLSLASIQRWIRPDGSGCVVKNRYGIEDRHGYEGYSAHSCYNMLACSMLAQAWEYADEQIEERPAPADVGGFVVPILQPFHKIFASAGGTYVEYDTSGDHVYNPTGLLRIHLKGGHPQLGPTDGCAPKFSGPGVNWAVGPEWRDESGWHRLAAMSPPRPSVETLEETPQRTRFRVTYDLGGEFQAALAEGRVGKAFDFSDPNSGGVLGGVYNLLAGDYSISFWFRPNEEKGDQQQALLAGTLDDRHAVYLELRDDTVRFVHRLPPGNGGGTELLGKLPKAAADTWRHLVVTRQNTHLALFLDGQPAAQGVDAWHSVGTLQIILANLYPTTDERHFSGRIDELRFDTRVLTPDEIAALAEGKQLSTEPAASWNGDRLPDARGRTITETITVEPDGVTIEDQVQGPGVEAIRVTFPLLVFDGQSETDVRSDGNVIWLALDGRGVRCVALEPPEGTWTRSGQTVGHRCGLVEPAWTEARGGRVVVRIEAN